MDPNATRDVSSVRRRRKPTRVPHREVTPEGKVGRLARNSSEEEESALSSSATTTTNNSNTQVSRNNSTKSASLSAHKSKILSRRDRAIAQQRSQSQPRPETSPPPTTAATVSPPKESKSSDFLQIFKKARRSLSSPRNKDKDQDRDSSRNASPNPTANGGRSERSPLPPSAPPGSYYPHALPQSQSQSLESQQLSKLELNMRRFEEERRKFETERRKFDAERRELDQIRLKRLEERDKKRIADGYQQLLAKRSAKDVSRKTSLKVSDPEENQRLIESFDRAQEMTVLRPEPELVLPPPPVSQPPVVATERKSKRSVSSHPRKKLLPPDLAPPNQVVRRAVSLRRRSPRPINSTSDDADDEYGTERKKSSDSNSRSPPKGTGSEKEKKGDSPKKETIVASEEDKKPGFFSRMFSRKSPEQKKLEQEAKELKKLEKKQEKDKLKQLKKQKAVNNNWKNFKARNQKEVQEIKRIAKKCVANTILLAILFGIGGLLFRFTEGALENFYKCGAKKVKRDFIDQLWAKSHSMREEEWKSLARNKLRTFEEELQVAFDSGQNSYHGQKAWSFINSCVYSFSVITTIGYGHIAPATTTGRAITILYSVIGIPIFLIVLADFGKLFTRGIKFLWAYVRGLYYTGSCRKVRKTVPMQDMVKGMGIAYDFMRRPSVYMSNTEDDVEKADGEGNENNQLDIPDDETTPATPMPSEIEIDDEFNLPISLALFILISYILLGAAMYSMWETWTFFESFYFVFISMSTIGFGDYVPNHPIFMMCSIIYLVFGLALTSMCINVVQLKLSDSFRQASSKIRETIGLADVASSVNETPCPDLKSAGIDTPTVVPPSPIQEKN